MSGEAFVQFVVDELAPKVFVGDDFRFGADRSGGFDALKRAESTRVFSERLWNDQRGRATG